MKTRPVCRGLDPKRGRQNAGLTLLTMIVCAQASAAQTSAAQIPALPDNPVPLGFTARPAFAETQQPHLVRAVLPDGGGILLAIGDRVYRMPEHAQRQLLIDVDHDIAFLARHPSGQLMVGLLQGDILTFDTTTMQQTAARRGVANSFDSVVLPNGDVLVSANPHWQLQGSSSGVWLVATTGAPRELLSLLGPSAPLELLDNGDLVVGELGAIVPPAPGTARLLRVPSSNLQLALTGQTLSMTDVTEIGAGYDGLYDLVADGDGRLFSSDPSTGRVTASIPGALAADGTWFDFGNNRFATHLRYCNATTGTFRSFQPAQRAPHVMVATTDYSNWFEVVRVHPRRPSITATPTGPQPAGTVTLTLDDAPPLGVNVWLASLAAARDEFAVTTIDGSPVWLGLPPADVVSIGTSAIDAQGNATWSFVNPGINLRIDWQAFAWSPAAACTSSTFSTFLQL